jgi:hypothetical protein
MATAQGISGGYADEMVGGMQAGFDKLTGSQEPYGDLYEKRRDERRALYKRAEDAHPAPYATSEFGGALVQGLKTPMIKAAKGAAAGVRYGLPMLQAGIQGAFQGAGYSEAKDASGVAKDAAISGVLNAGTAGALQAGGEGAVALGRKMGVDKAYDYVKTKMKQGGKKALSLFGGVSEQNIDRYRARPDQINAIGEEGIEGVKKGLDEDIDKFGKLRTTAEEERIAANEARKNALADKRQASIELQASRQATREADSLQSSRYREEVGKLKDSSAPSGAAENIMEAAELEKKTLGELSRQVDDALARDPRNFSKNDLLGLIRKVGRSVGVGEDRIVIGEQSTAAISKLKSMYDRIDSLPDNLTPKELREIMKEISPDINWHYGAGEFNEVEDRLKKDVRKGISTVLKGNTEYEKYMERMSDLSNNLEDLSKVFGSKEKALAAVDAITKGKSPRATVARETLERYAKATGRLDLIQEIDKAAEARALAARAGKEDLSEQLVPKEFAASRGAREAQGKAEQELMAREAAIAAREQELALKEAAQSDLVQQHAPISGLSTARSQPVIKNMMGNNPDVDDRKALEALQGMTGNNYLEKAQDLSTYNAFDRSVANGARRTLGGAAVGGLVNVVGQSLGSDDEINPMSVGQAMVTGGSAGFVADRYGPAMTKAILDSARRGTLGAAGARITRIIEQSAQRGPDALRATTFLILKQFPTLKDELESQ